MCVLHVEGISREKEGVMTDLPYIPRTLLLHDAGCCKPMAECNCGRPMGPTDTDPDTGEEYEVDGAVLG